MSTQDLSRTAHDIQWDAESGIGTWKSDDGRLSLQFQIQTYQSEILKNVMERWAQNDRVDKAIDATISCKAKYLDKDGMISERYNPTVREADPGSLDEYFGHRTRDWDWVLEATPQNLDRLIDEAERMRAEDIKVHPMDFVKKEMSAAPSTNYEKQEKRVGFSDAADEADRLAADGPLGTKAPTPEHKSELEGHETHE